MIVWIASYPRSGNSLLRTVLFQTMGLQHYVESPFGADDSKPEEHVKADRAVGLDSRAVEDWSEFVAHAADSKKVFLIKTHQPPQDDSPVLHMVRDGRQACISYFHYLQDQFPEAQKTLLDIVAGNDHCSHWSRHYLEWAGQAHRLEVRYEDLIEPSTEQLKKMASFLNYNGEVKSWENPFDDLRELKPHIFREGRNERIYPPEWDESVELLFQRLHGELNQALGYVENEKKPALTAEVFEKYAAFMDRTGLQYRYQQAEINRLRN